MTASMRIIKPDGTNLTSWTHASASSYSGSNYSYTRTMPSVPGAYVFEAVYNGSTCTKTFHVACGTSTAVENLGEIKTLRVYPNPTQNQLHISGEGMDNGNYNIYIRNMLGQLMLSEKMKVDNGTVQYTLGVSQLPASLYTITIESDTKKEIIKFEKSE